MQKNIRYAIIVPVYFLFVSISVAQPWEKHGRLSVPKDNPHYIIHADGTPFLWIGDTAWEHSQKKSNPSRQLIQ